MNQRFRAIAIATCLLVPTAASTPSVGAATSWTLAEDRVTLGMNGVSPHVERVAGGDRVWRSDMVPSGTAVSLCNDGGACSPETLSVTGGPVSDFAVAISSSGPRAYFKRMTPSAQAVYSSPCLDANCLSIGEATLTTSDMQVSRDMRAWGVPDPVRLPDGRIRIYIVESPDLSSSCPEKVASYVSTDGITFAKEPGWRLEGGYVDTEVLRATTGNWLMIMADGPGCQSASGGRKSQQLYVSTSSDGLTWSKPQVLTGTDTSRLDPTGYETAPGSNEFRIYYAESRVGSDYRIQRATLKIGAAVTKPGKKTTITCVKGKMVKKVTGVAPKCPKGYRKR